MTTSTVAPEIVRFAEGVRAALSDLPSDEVDDLTEGLEADLAESLAEDLRRTLPDPVDYAAELRLAAGLPAAATRASRGSFGGMTESIRAVRREMTDVVGRNPALESGLEFLVSLRPAWWIVRAWLATWLIAAFFGMEHSYGFDGLFWIVMVAFAVISVQWGRGRGSFAGLRAIIITGNVIAVLALVAVLNAIQSYGDSGAGAYDAGFADGSSSSSTDGSVPAGEGQGLSMDGQPIENIYAYDAAGNKLTGVQLFDVDGKPLTPYRNVDETQVLQYPATLDTGVKVYNVYPLTVTRMTGDSNGEMVPDPNPDPDKAKAYADGPFLKVPAVQAPQPVAQPNE